MRTIALLACLLTGCLDQSDCGPMPIPPAVSSREIVIDEVSSVTMSTKQWDAHEAWTTAVVDWGHCVEGR